MISTKGRYALRVIVDLAEHQQGEEYIPLKDIAARQEISEKYLEIILKVLVKEKLLKGLRGKGGGYRLTREPKDYPVGEILSLTEGTLAPVACLTEDADPCERSANCSTLRMWQRFDNLTHDFFYTITVADLMDGGEQTK
ncbi:MAG: Rrf2 family transcriptional regulator [Lachnospiraceae bacterium]|nr:Rrf2 family transcriptional regulator [Lachnospiraceae bacterium]